MNTMIEELLTVGDNYGITIGTELAIDTIVTDKSEHNLPVHINNYGCLYINIYTLVRNVLSQFTVKTLDVIDHTSVVRVVLNDMRIINDITQSITIVYYASTLMTFASHKLAPYIRQPRTNKQRRVAQLIGYVVNKIALKQKATTFDGPFKSTGRHLILTNLMMDLLDNNSAHLLESHTGVVRDKLTWYNKLHPIKHVDMKIFPPLYKMMLFLGTKDIFTPKTFNHLREQLVRSAEDNKWSAITTEQQLKSDIHRDQVLYNNWNQAPDLSIL